MNVYTGETRNWDDLTPEQQTSGEWIKLAPLSDAGPVLTRRRSVLDDLATSHVGKIGQPDFKRLPTSGSAYDVKNLR